MLSNFFNSIFLIDVLIGSLASIGSNGLIRVPLTSYLGYTCSLFTGASTLPYAALAAVSVAIFYYSSAFYFSSFAT